MASYTKLLGTETDLTTATTVGAARLVRLHNTSTTVAIQVTQKNASAATIASVTLTVGEVIVLEKSTTDTLEGGADILAVSVAYSN